MGIFSVLYLSLFFVDAMLWVDTSFHHGLQKSPKKQALPFTCWVLCIRHTMHRIYIYIYSSQKVWWAVFWWDLLPRSSLLAFCISMVIWNDWKWSRLTTKWCIRVGINQTLWLVSWLKCERQLSVAQLTPQTKKLKQMQNSNRWKVFWHHWNMFLVMYNHPTPLENPYQILEFEHTNVCAGIQRPRTCTCHHTG